MITRVATLCRMALLDLVRQRRRTTLSILITVFGVVAVLLTRSWQNGMMEQIEREGASVWLGAVQVIPPSSLQVRNALALEPNLPAEGPLVAEIGRTPSVTAVSPRIRFFGRLFNGDLSAPMIALGYDAATVAQVVPRLFEPERLESGRLPDPAHQDEILVAAPLAAALGLHAGDRATILARPVDGGLEGVDVTVVGVARAAFEENQRRAVLIDLRLASKLLRMDGRATELVVGVEPLVRSHEVAAQLSRNLATITPVEVRPWDEINPRYQAARRIWSTTLGVMFLAVVMVAALGLSTTLVLIVRERAQEVATLAALGFSRAALVAMFAVEGALLGTVGGLFGSASGYAVVTFLHAHGVRYDVPGGFPLTVRPALNAFELMLAVAVVALIASVVGMIPAWRAARRAPSELLR
jgi:putative ABC transport system permease protein